MTILGLQAEYAGRGHRHLLPEAGYEWNGTKKHLGCGRNTHGSGYDYQQTGLIPWNKKTQHRQLQFNAISCRPFPGTRPAGCWDKTEGN